MDLQTAIIWAAVFVVALAIGSAVTSLAIMATGRTEEKHVKRHNGAGSRPPGAIIVRADGTIETDPTTPPRLIPSPDVRPSKELRDLIATIAREEATAALDATHADPTLRIEHGDRVLVQATAIGLQPDLAPDQYGYVEVITKGGEPVHIEVPRHHIRKEA